MLNFIIRGPTLMIVNTAFHVSDREMVDELKAIIKLNGPSTIKIIGRVRISHNEAINIIWCRHCDVLFGKDIVYICFKSML